ncbi:MAG: hypothetical protein B9S30_08415 [Verrucomicrobiia bacterium Tous-C5FEB]|nr:MAG: hypothetical protein B9S30_08415 [Verrucomicrobiae bacterium Tous-C5FEB]
MFYPPFALEPDPADSLPSRASMARGILRLKFSEYSEDHFMAGWVKGLEFFLWDHLHGIPQETPFGGPSLDASEIGIIRGLSILAGGWWVWPDTIGEEGVSEIFIPMDRWMACHDSRSREKHPS